MTRRVDVLICGGGPVGLAVAYQLARFGVTACTIEKFEKETQMLHGRAGCIYPRTLELLDQLDLGDAIHQVGFLGRAGTTYKNGQRVFGRGWTFLSQMKDTYIDYTINLRQKYTEDVIREALLRAGGEFHFQHSLQSFSVNKDSVDDYKVKAIVLDADGAEIEIMCKYLVGADGGKSKVRDIAKIPFEGESTERRWVRMDAVIKTDMPDSRLGVGAIESDTHGSILWVPNDHGGTRFGYTVTPKLWEKYKGALSMEDMIYEAKQAMHPFKVEFERVDWHTVYTIRQQLAKHFRADERIFIAGDAAHIHSSAAAQGMNNGVHDAVNLAWKLAGKIKGLYKASILDTYEAERRPVAEYVIRSDKILSALASGNIPEELSATGEDPHILYGRFFDDNVKYTSGLGISYDTTCILNKETPLLNVLAGHRGPDTLIHKPGSIIPTRLYQITKNTGKYWIVVFAGQPLLTKSGLHSFRKYLDSSDSFTKTLSDAFEFCTILIGSGRQGQGDETLGVTGFGNKYYDPDETAHLRYGIPPYQGAILCLRPDGMLGYAAMLNEGPSVGEYFQEIVASKTRS